MQVVRGEGGGGCGGITPTQPVIVKNKNKKGQKQPAVFEIHNWGIRIIDGINKKGGKKKLY